VKDLAIPRAMPEPERVHMSHWRPGCIVCATRPAGFNAGRILFRPPVWEKFMQGEFFG
jgi:hypothetical protein